MRSAVVDTNVIVSGLLRLCALEARADYVVTGNLVDFPDQIQDIRIVVPRQFLTPLTADPR
ncbi:MAG TPA: hypothetical protein VIX91_18760 [Candidatus Acidoferrum sp.]